MSQLSWFPPWVRPASCWCSCPSLFLIMLLVLETGRRIGKRYYSMEESEHHRGNRILVESAIYGLLGLLIAFTVSGAANRFDARRT